MKAIKYTAKVDSKGNLVLPRTRLKKGSVVEVIVLISDETSEDHDLVAASAGNLDFWDNALDDKIWNDI
ncbi:MAG: hypothetical protein SGI88_13845 [Candidatus Hydrogenedentes bacterium]|nr:hypothetical protein [Candidatus Hydrogenedentota bacterium]